MRNNFATNQIYYKYLKGKKKPSIGGWNEPSQKIQL